MNFISGDKFYNVTDYIYYPKINWDNNILQDNFCNSNIGDGKITVYCHIHLINSFFDFILKNKIKNEIILVSHNSDWPVDENLFLKKPKNITKWFSQNVNFEAKNLFSIPIGLENDKWFPELQKKNKMLKKLQEQKNFINLLYINHNVSNNYNERIIPYQIFNGKKWVTLTEGKNGNNFDDYLDNLYNHKFIICPVGVGLDTHRLWEALYMGCIPIEKKNINNKFYEDLPICFVNDWSEINELFLEKEFERIMSIEWNLEKLDFEYWKKIILNT